MRGRRLVSGCWIVAGGVADGDGGAEKVKGEVVGLSVLNPVVVETSGTFLGPDLVASPNSLTDPAPPPDLSTPPPSPTLSLHTTALAALPLPFPTIEAAATGYHDSLTSSALSHYLTNDRSAHPTKIVLAIPGYGPCSVPTQSEAGAPLGHVSWRMARAAVEAGVFLLERYVVGGVGRGGWELRRVFFLVQ